MILPPFSVKIHIIEKGKKKIKLWFPFILVWLIVFAFALLLSPLVLLAALILWPWKLGKKLLMFGPMFFYVLSSLHGLKIYVERLDEHVSISF